MEKQHLRLGAKDKRELEALLAKGSLPVKVFKRATALLELDRGRSFGAVAKTLGVCYQSVSSWCAAYKEMKLSMLWDAPRSGRPIEIDGEQRAKITALACSEAPVGHARWSLRLLADKAVELGYVEHLSHNHAGEILKKMS
ncbi:MAG TPA: helix-turn-helix domain-containing protein [Nitrososphaera sp.]|jgi:transposase|nr:helix-turn-helix domain-containing protein [Nitrososphaera sp.]